jgi:DNA-directed RNA polymerase specialized sigma24 family protein
MFCAAHWPFGLAERRCMDLLRKAQREVHCFLPIFLVPYRRQDLVRVGAVQHRGNAAEEHQYAQSDVVPTGDGW